MSSTPLPLETLLAQLNEQTAPTVLISRAAFPAVAHGRGANQGTRRLVLPLEKVGGKFQMPQDGAQFSYLNRLNGATNVMRSEQELCHLDLREEDWQVAN